MKKLTLALMTLLMVISIVPVMTFTSSAASVSIPKGASTYKGSTYCVIDKVVTWKEAKVLCENMGGHLATITSEKESTYVAKLIRKKVLHIVGSVHPM